MLKQWIRKFQRIDEGVPAAGDDDVGIRSLLAQRAENFVTSFVKSSMNLNAPFSMQVASP
jgi:hypothetical protein